MQEAEVKEEGPWEKPCQVRKLVGFRRQSSGPDRAAVPVNSVAELTCAVTKYCHLRVERAQAPTPRSIAIDSGWLPRVEGVLFFKSVAFVR